MARILIVEGDASAQQWLDDLLRDEGFASDTVTSLEAAVDVAAGDGFDCVIVGAAGGSAGEACRRLRAATHAPILCMVARDATLEKIAALEMGADETVSRPVFPRELTARIRALVRARTEYSRPLELRMRWDFGALAIDGVRQEAFVQGRPVALTRRELAVLQCLARNEGTAVRREAIFEEVWGYDVSLSGKLLDVTIRRLRRKIEPVPRCPTYIHTVRGFGYRLDAANG
ncbi:MAG TPA: response regulator transcription factor [Armatimonadota bacterium]|jgi:DNA-binding response OmpR family regulator